MSEPTRCSVSIDGPLRCVSPSSGWATDWRVGRSGLTNTGQARVTRPGTTAGDPVAVTDHHGRVHSTTSARSSFPETENQARAELPVEAVRPFPMRDDRARRDPTRRRPKRVPTGPIA
jgi:hypothetical protein